MLTRRATIHPPRVAIRSRRATRARDGRRLRDARVRASARITLVRCDVKAEAMDDFLRLTEENARASVREAGNVRFDVLRDEKDRNLVTLVEIYADDASAAKHKETKHYETWRDEVADMMAAPRSAETYLAIEPNDDAWTYANAVTWNEDDDQSEMVNASCVHVHCECAAGDEAAFASACAKNASESALEDGNLRFDVFQSAESARKFLLVEVYDGAASAVAHKSTPHYEAWREEVANMMARPRQARAYDVVFPPTKISWREDACGDACDTTW